MIIIPLIILCTVHPHPSTLLWLPVTTNLPLPGFPISWIRWGLCCRGFLQRLPWFSPWVAVVLYKGCRGFLHFLGKQSQLLLCPTQVELGLSRQSGVRQKQTLMINHWIFLHSSAPPLFCPHTNLLSRPKLTWWKGSELKGSSPSLTRWWRWLTRSSVPA